MPHSPSAKKRLRQNEMRRVHNKSIRSTLSTRRRRFQQAISAGELDAANTALIAAQKSFDQAAAKGVIHKNTAARKVARMYKHLEQARAETA